MDTHILAEALAKVAVYHFNASLRFVISLLQTLLSCCE